ncbi:MAG: Spy/CpxP family protein refolding chaperone [Ginsengibacter sp.]
MKKLFLIVLASCFFVINSNAQVKRDVTQSQKVRSDSSHHFRKDKMKNDLNLTPDQKAQMKTLRESNKEQRDAIKNDASLTPEQKKARMKDLHKTQSDKMNSILTPDQQAKRKAYMEKMRANRKMQGNKGAHKSNKSTGTTPAKSGSGS